MKWVYSAQKLGQGVAKNSQVNLLMEYTDFRTFKHLDIFSCHTMGLSSHLAVSENRALSCPLKTEIYNKGKSK